MAKGDDDLLTIGAMSKSTGATPRAIRFYEGLGLVSSSKRSPGGYRLFPRKELARLNLVIGLRRSGFSIKAILALFTATEKNRTAAAAARAVNEALTSGAEEIAQAAESLRLLAADLSHSAKVLTRCLDCHKSFDDLNCGECEAFRDLKGNDRPMAFEALWPSSKD